MVRQFYSCLPFLMYSAKVLGAAAAAMRSQNYKFGFGESDGNSLVVSSFTPASLGGGTILVAMSYQGLSFICSSRGIESCPEDRRGEMVRAVSLANYGIRHGGFAMDHTDGEVRYQTDLPLPSFTLEELPKILEAMIAINLQTHERYYLALRDVRDGKKTGQEAIEHVEGPMQPVSYGSATSNVEKAKEIVKGCLRKLNITFAQRSTTAFVGTKSVPPAQKDMTVKCQVEDVVMCLTSFIMNSAPAVRPALTECVCRANYGLQMGQFIIDHRDGEILFQTEVIVPRGNISLEHLTELIAPVIMTNISTHQRYIPAFEDVRNGSKTPAVAIQTVLSAPPPAVTGRVTPPAAEPPVEDAASSIGEFADVMLNVGKITSVVGKLGDNLARGAMFQAVYASNPVVLRSVTFDSTQRLKEFLTSIRAHGRIHHSALVGVYGVVHGKVVEQGGVLRVVEDSSKWLLVTQFCALGSIANWLDCIGNGRSQFYEYLAIRMVEEIALGMSMLHERGIVHQDLTIDNVFINDDKHAMISNFGLREHFDKGSLKDNETLAQGLDRSGLFHLDASCLESGVPNKASDVFAFGVLLHHLFVSKSSKPTLYTDADLQMALATGKRQRAVELFREKMKNGMRPTLGSLDTLSPPVKAAISRLLNICLDTHPTNRPSFEEVAVTLHQVRQYLDGQGANSIPAVLFPSASLAAATPIIMGPAMHPLPTPPSSTTFQLLPTMEKIRAGLGIDPSKRLDEALLEAGEILGISDEITALKTARERAIRIATEMGEL